MSHSCVMSLADEGIEECVDCGRTRMVATPSVPECSCGRGYLALFLIRVGGVDVVCCAPCQDEHREAAAALGGVA